jgi:hypothetical protein
LLRNDRALALQGNILSITYGVQYLINHSPHLSLTPFMYFALTANEVFLLWLLMLYRR